MDDESAEGGAALACGAHGGEGDGAEGEVEIGGGGDDGCVVAAEFEDGLAKRAASFGATARPMAVDPVAETRGMIGESTSCWPTVASPMRSVARPAGMVPNLDSNFFAARSKMACVASAVNGVFSLGFQTTASPQTSARAAFQLQTATGEVEGGDDADDAEGMPGLHHAVFGAFRGDGKAGELAREAGGEGADVDHLLNFAEAFGEELAGFDGDEAAEGVDLGRGALRRGGG